MATYKPIVTEYTKTCVACGKAYYSKRKHSKTCSSYCRLQLFKYGRNILATSDLKSVSRKFLKDLSAEEHKRIADHFTSGNLQDSNGNVLEFFGGHKDDAGYVRRLVFHIKSKCLLDVWDIGENGKVKHTFYKCK